MSKDVITVVIEPDTSRFEAAMAEAIKQVTSLWWSLPVRVRHALWERSHADRARCRAVTRRKQRRHW